MKWLDLYETEILENNIVVCKKIKKAIKRIRYLADKYNFKQEFADYPIDFIEKYCKHYKSSFAGSQFKLNLWQKVIIEATYGIVDDEDNRVIEELFIIVARKNGKSTFASGLSLEMLVAENEAGAEIYSVANKKEQAQIIYKACYEMVSQSVYLRRIIHKKRAQLEYGSSVLKALASDSNSLDGLLPFLAIYDESHATKTLDLYGVIKSAYGSAKNALLANITTAGYVREGLFDYLYKYSEDILNEVTDDDTFMPFIFELDKEDDYHDEALWVKANPNLGVSVSIDAIRTDLKRADNDPKAKNELLTKRFNLPQSTSKAYYELEDIRNDTKFDEEEIRGRYCLIGLDLSKTNDLTSISFYFPFGKGNKTKIYLKQMYMLPDMNILQKQKQDKKPYLTWVEEGYMKLTKGYMIDPNFIVNYIINEIERLDLHVYAICVDAWNIDRVETSFVNAGFQIEKVIQGYKTLSPAVQNADAQLQEKRVIHNNNPLLVWNFLNVGMDSDVNGNQRPIKGNGNANKIDGYMSYLDCVAVHSRADVKDFFETYQGGEK